MVQQITTDDLRRMEGREGIVFQGCGGDPQEWVDGINDMLTEEGVLLNGSLFKAEDVSLFQHGELICLLFPFERVELNPCRFAVWRIQTHSRFGGTWLSDYVPNKLGGFLKEQQKPERFRPSCPLIGQNGNIFNLVSIAAGTLREYGMDAEAKELTDRIMGGQCHSYEEALAILTDYVQPTDVLTQRPQGRHQRAKENVHEH